MLAWPHNVQSYTTAEVQRFCTQDELWQKFREKLRSLPTPQKLDQLDQRIQLFLTLGAPDDMRRIYVQVDNYLQALRRGGLLDPQFRVVR